MQAINQVRHFIKLSQGCDCNQLNCSWTRAPGEKKRQISSIRFDGRGGGFEAAIKQMNNTQPEAPTTYWYFSAYFLALVMIPVLSFSVWFFINKV